MFKPLTNNSNSSSDSIMSSSRYSIFEHSLRRHVMNNALAYAGLSLAFFAVGSMIYHSHQSQLIPYVVTVDSHGVVLSGSALEVRQEIPRSIIIAQICDFIRNLRTVSPDHDLQQQAIVKCYAFLAKGSQAERDITASYKEHNPLKNSDTAVHVTIINALAVNDHSLQVDWREGEKIMRALISYTVSEPEKINTAETLLLNPLCISIHEFTMGEILK